MPFYIASAYLKIQIQHLLSRVYIKIYYTSLISQLDTTVTICSTETAFCRPINLLHTSYILKYFPINFLSPYFKRYIQISKFKNEAIYLVQMILFHNEAMQRLFNNNKYNNNNVPPQGKS